MPVSGCAIARALSAVFGTDFICELSDEETDRMVISMCGLPISGGFRVEVTRPYDDTVKAVVRFDSFAAPLVERWFEDVSRVERAYAFVEEVSDCISLNVSVAGKPVSSPEEFIAAKDGRAFGVRVSCKQRNIDSDLRDDCCCSVAIATVGFALFSSGLLVDDRQGAFEGARKSAVLSEVERNRGNRARCIAFHGSRCAVCGFDFGSAYGAFAEGFIEVHHKNPVSSLGGSVRVDPVADMVPLCPNCHAAVHMENPPIEPERLKAMFLRNAGMHEIS